MVDDKIYSVTGPNGFRRGSLTRVEADKLVARMRDVMERAGWSGKLEVFYRDGSRVRAVTVSGPR